MKGTLQRLIKSWLPRPVQDSEPAGRISVLAITADDRDRRSLSLFSIRGQWDLSFTNTCEDALDLLKDHPATVIVLDRDLPGSDWRKTLEMLSGCGPECPIILVSSVCDEYLWEEVVHNGGYDVLRKPLQEEQAVRAVNLAWSYSNTGLRAY
jgi:FixJ family two-component response regulator